ncbi:C45 family peptidase [Flagellimonas sp.]|uniref:C45 family autoproteolytic acyltransferase/hydolase n=1 Tax=Flagellimonas sp. TaxID=2058762 RepID=UPI000C0A0DFD|nr:MULTISPECIES: C45 family peptidase [unclassified Allomuricauda]MAU14109.1 peptidase C45 [Allomuricauda sp.]|tara:strand:- start:21584 stop:22591 length:1008 start_codon:yes stop_codon:yes gene_type:complete
MYHPRLYGRYYDMGFKYGKLLYEKVNFGVPIISNEKMDFGLKSYQMLREYYPEVIEEIEGFACGIQDRPEVLGAFLLSLGVFDTTGQCSVFAYRNKEDVIIGRNYDMRYDFKKFTESSLIAPMDRYAYIGQSDVFIGRSDGINEKGLFIAMSFVNGTKVQPGIGFHFIIRKVLENCSVTKQAIEVVQQANISTACNFLIADRMGELAVVESCPQGSFVRRPGAGEQHLFITNQFQSAEMKAFEAEGVAWSKSAERYQGMETLLGGMDGMDLQKAKAILSDGCVCLDLKKERFGTIWSVVSNLNKGIIERAETKPRMNNYKQDTRLAWWLQKRSRS